jgi:hypothetical protein
MSDDIPNIKDKNITHGINYSDYDVQVEDKTISPISELITKKSEKSIQADKLSELKNMSSQTDGLNLLNHSIQTDR